MAKFDGKPRRLVNGAISLPYSTSFKIKKVHDYDELKSTIKVKLCMKLRIKFTGLDDKIKLMEETKKKLRIAIDHD